MIPLLPLIPARSTAFNQRAPRFASRSQASMSFVLGLCFLLAVLCQLVLGADSTSSTSHYPSLNPEAPRPATHLHSHIEALAEAFGGHNNVELGVHRATLHVNQLIVKNAQVASAALQQQRHGRDLVAVTLTPVAKAKLFFSVHGSAFGIPPSSEASSTNGNQTPAPEDTPPENNGALSTPTEGTLRLESSQRDPISGKTHLRFRHIIFRNHSVAVRHARSDPSDAQNDAEYSTPSEIPDTAVSEYPPPASSDEIRVFGSVFNVAFDENSQLISVVGQYVHDAHYVNRTDIRVSKSQAVRNARMWVIKNCVAALQDNSTERAASVDVSIQQGNVSVGGVELGRRDDGFLKSPFASQMQQLAVVYGPELTIYHLGLLQGLPIANVTDASSAGQTEAVLTYQIILRTVSRALHERVFVSAVTGQVVAHIPMQSNAISRRVSITTAGSTSLTTVWSEGAAYPTSNAEYNNMILSANDFYNLLTSMTKGVYKSINGADLTLQMVLDVAVTLSQCPNAFFDGTKAVFCSGVVTDDVVPHELAHGLTQYNSGLVYSYQSGAMNEALSDIFGEVVDRINGRGTDTPDALRAVDVCVSYKTNVRWLMGEDSSAFGGPIRDMYNPDCMRSPGSVQSTNYYCGTSDNGGVHTNSGVINRLFAFLTDGAVYNGVTVTGIGLTKSTHIVLQAQRYYFTTISDFNSAGGELYAACQSLVGKAVPDFNVATLAAQWPTTSQTIVQSDCDQVNNAANAVSLRTAPSCSLGYRVNIASKALCDAVNANNQPQSRYNFFTENFESQSLNTNGWSISTQAVKPSTWNGRNWVVQQLAYGRSSYGAFAADPNAGDCASNDQAGVMYLTSKSISIPSNLPSGMPVQLGFDHYFATESQFDGGVVFYSVNGGAFTQVPTSYFTYNPYPGALATTSPGYNTDPLRGLYAFSGAASTTSASGAWITSIISFPSTALKAGDSVVMQWQLGSDSCGGVVGWYVDEINVYSCAVDACSVSGCNNGGTCANSVAGKVCTCINGYSGSDCSIAPTSTPPVTYSWSSAAFSTCSVTCGSGTQTRSVTCVDSSSNVVADSFCTASTKPVTTQACSNAACPTWSWNSGSWTTCSANCGGGVQTRTVVCTASDGTTAADSACSGTKPITTQSCATNACASYQWTYSPYGSCSATCGVGVQTRTATCQQITPTTATVADSFCSNLVKGTLSQVCSASSVCPSYQWTYSSYGSCSATCGTGVQTRTATCQQTAPTQANVADSFCSNLVKDTTSQVCSGSVCGTYQWTYSPYGSCSASCGTGVQSRTATCQQTSPTQANVADSFCSGQTKDTLSQVCSASQPCPTYQWTYSSYGSCSATCGTGVQTRTATCQQSSPTQANVADSFCSGQTKDTLSQICSASQACPTYQWTYSSYGSCSATCGTGVQTRTATCQQTSPTQASVVDSFCAGQTKDTLSQVCSASQACPTYQWNYSAYSPCSVTCGTGVQTRTATCSQVSSPQSQVADSFCSNVAKDVVSQACTLDACPNYTWQYGAWGSCSITCRAYDSASGSYSMGVRTRTQTCIKTANGINVATDAANCANVASLGTTQSCGDTLSRCVSYSWFTSAFNACSQTCGNGTQTRTVACNGDDGLTYGDSYCSGIKPPVQQTCNLGACPTYSYAYSAWGACTSPCGNSTRTRTVSCTSSASPTPVAISICDNTPGLVRQSTVDACTLQPCPTYSWKYTDYSTCSASCGSGVRTRTAYCVSNANPTVGLGAIYCSGITQDALTAPCDAGSCNGVSYRYAYGSFGVCVSDRATNCGTGVQTKSTLCYEDTLLNGNVVSERQVPSTLCSNLTIPAVTQVCSLGPCVKYSFRILSVSECTPCGVNATRTRKVICSPNERLEVVADSFCTDSGLTKPAVTVSCTNPCQTYLWTYSNFTDCNVLCGVSTISRTATCVRSLDHTVVDASNCAGQTKLPLTSICSAAGGSCLNYQWQTSAWNACSASCNQQGLQTRTVTCTNVQTNVQVSDSYCDLNKSFFKPATQQTCKGTC